MKWKNKKVGLSLLVSLILLSSLLGYQLGLSSVPAVGPYYLDVPFGTASYYIGPFDNGSFYMVRGDTWQSTLTDTNASYVVQSAIDALSPASGNVFLRKAVYEFSVTVKVPSYVNFIGEGRTATYIKAPSGGIAISLKGIDTNMDTKRVIFQGLNIYGSGIGNGEIGIDFSGGYQGIVRDCYFSSLDTGIKLDAVLGGSGVNAYANSFENIQMSAVLVGFNLTTSNIGLNAPNANTIINCEVLNTASPVGSRGIFLKGGECTIIGGRYEGNEIDIEIDYNANLILNPYCGGTSKITLTTNAENNYVIGAFSGVYTDNGGNNTIIDLAVVTEKSGTATNSTATTFVFNHGLAGTPTGVWASFNTTAINGWAWTATSTQITVTVLGSGLPSIMATYWKAEYIA